MLFFLIGIADLKDVIEYVFDLNMSQFKQLGLWLGLLSPTLHALDELADVTKPEDYGTKVMADWLNQVDNAQPTWNNLAKALDKKTVRAHVQAAQIREDLKNGEQNVITCIIIIIIVCIHICTMGSHTFKGTADVVRYIPGCRDVSQYIHGGHMTPSGKNTKCKRG